MFKTGVQLQQIFRTNIISLLDSSKGFSISACRRFKRDKQDKE
jgi:hypothetical protein